MTEPDTPGVFNDTEPGVASVPVNTDPVGDCLRTDKHSGQETIPSYSKEEEVIDTQYLFVVSGGAKRERDYLRIFENHESNRLRLVFVSKDGQGLTPGQMRGETVESIEEECFLDINGNLTHLADDDSIYLVSDVDEYGDDLIELLKEKGTRYSWIISNPAFEVWLYYHYFDNPNKISEVRNIPVAQRSRWLKTELDKVRAGGINPKDAFMLMETAIRNSIANYSLQHNGLPELFSTQMHLLAIHVQSILKDEFSEMIVQRNNRAMSFLTKIKDS